MRSCILFVAITVIALTGATAQEKSEDASPSDVAPPAEINLPTNPENLPAPSSDPMPVDGSADGAKHLKIGTIVTGGVELYPKVRVKNGNAIHPRAQPFILAVMDPHEGPWHPHYKIRKFIAGEVPDDPRTPVVFVRVMLPPEALAAKEIKREEIEFEYGGREVNIDCEDGVVTIDYDD